MKVKLTKTVRDFSGSPYPKGSVLKEDRTRRYDNVLGTQRLPLEIDEWRAR
jgi:hypothetical protein